MKRMIFALFAVLSTGAFAHYSFTAENYKQQNWRYIGSIATDSGEIIGIHFSPNSIYNKGLTSSLWTMNNYKSPTKSAAGTTYLSESLFIKFDCVQSTYSIEIMVFHSEKMAEGKILEVVNLEPEFVAVPKAGKLWPILEVACKEQ